MKSCDERPPRRPQGRAPPAGGDLGAGRPLALALLELLRGDPRSAAARIGSVRHPRRVTERVVKRVLSSMVIVFSAKGEAGIGQAHQAAVHDTVGLLEEASEWPIAQFPLWLREWLADEVGQRLRKKRFFGGKQTAPGLLALRTSLLETRGGNAQTGSAPARPADPGQAGTAPARTRASRRADTRKAVRGIAQAKPAPGEGRPKRK